MVGQNSLRHCSAMEKSDPFLEGLRQIFEVRPELTPSAVSVAAGLDNSTLRKLLNGSNSSPRIDTAKRIADAMGYSLSDIIAIGEHDNPRLLLGLVEKLRALDPNLLNQALDYAHYLQAAQAEKRALAAEQKQAEEQIEVDEGFCEPLPG